MKHGGSHKGSTKIPVRLGLPMKPGKGGGPHKLGLPMKPGNGLPNKLGLPLKNKGKR